MSIAELAQHVKVLGDPARLRILAMLPSSDSCDQVRSVTELAQQLGVPQPTVSHHLRVLYQAGFLKCRKTCRDVHYWIDKPAVDAALAAVRNVVDE